MMMKIFLLTLVRDAIPDSNSAVVVNTLQKAVEPVEPKGLHDFAAIFLNLGMPPPPFEQYFKQLQYCWGMASLREGWRYQIE